MAGRTFRVFVSSTFSDLKAERNALARWVFPRLRGLCESRGYKFQAVDLRWGVRDEAAADQQTVRICLDEIARCQRLSPRPNFIVLLGDRYGWCPPPSLIPADEMDALRPHLTVTDVEVVDGWYRRDDNAVPSEFVLQPRRGAFEAYEVWAPVERRLHEALAGAARAAQVSEAALYKYIASATEQEIEEGVLDERLLEARKVPGVHEHVFAFFRTITNLDEVKRALPATSDLLDASEGTDPVTGDTRLVSDDGAWQSLNRLRTRLRDRLGDNVWECETSWDGKGLIEGHIGAPTPGAPAPSGSESGVSSAPEIDLPKGGLCEAVWQRLSRVIIAEMDTADREAADPLDVEKRAHAEFGAERSRVFVGRADPRQRIAGYLSSGPPRPLVVHGTSGSGKSALMARAIADARAAHPGAVVSERFIGASPGASEIRPLLESLCQEIGRAFGGDQAAIGDYPKLVAELPRRLALATADRPLIVFLDALDQLGETDDGRRLVWLPRELPANVRIVVSTLEDEKYQCFPTLRAGAHDGDFVRVEPLTKDEGREILTEWLRGSPGEASTEGRSGELSPGGGMTEGPRRGSRRLTTALAAEPGRPEERGQLDLVLAKFETGPQSDNGSPLYLKLAFEEARRWHSYDGDAPAEALPEGVAGVIRTLFARLSDPSQHGPLVTGRALAYLAAARYGLSDDEMLDLLWRHPDVRAELQEHARKHHRLPTDTDALPPVIWSRLFFDLDPYLAERDIFGVRLFSFYHRQLGEVAAEEYLDSARERHPGVSSRHLGREGQRDGASVSSRVRIHTDLAAYFSERWRRSETHALLELIGHLVRGGRDRDARDLLLEYEWLAKKLAATNVRLLLGDYDELSLDRQEPAGLVGGALRLSGHVLGESPIELGAQILGRMLDFEHPEIRQLMEVASGSMRPPALLPLARRLVAPGGPLLRTLVGHQGEVNSVAVTADGRTCISASWDKTLKVWDLGTGALIRTLVGHHGDVTFVTVTPDGRTAVSDSQPLPGQAESQVKVWDLATGALTRTFAGQDGPRGALGVSADGLTCVSVQGEYLDRTLRVWNLSTGEIIRTLAGHKAEVTAVVVSADGRTCVSASWDKTLKVWDLATGEDRLTLVGHKDAVLAVALTSNDRICVSASVDGTLKVWDLGAGRILRTLAGQHGPIYRIAVAADARTCISASEVVLEAWGVSAGERLGTFRGHQGNVRAVAMTADGKTCVSASSDMTLKVWDIGASDSLQEPVGHQDRINAVVVTSNGRSCVSASWDETLKVWDLGTGENLRTLVGHRGPVNAVAVTADGRIAVSASADETLKVWDLARGKIVRTLAGHESSVLGAAVLADGRRCISASWDKTLKVWDLATGNNVWTLAGHEDSVYFVAVTPDGRVCVSACQNSQDHTLRVWDLATGTLLRILAGHEYYGVIDVAVTPDGRSCVSASSDQTLKVWDLATGKNLRTLEGHGNFVTAVAMTPDGRSCVSASWDMTLKIWDLATGENLRTLEGHGDIVTAVAVTPDSRTVVSASKDKTLRVWDLASRVPPATFTGDAQFSHIAVTPDGRRLVAGDALGGVHFFDLLLPQTSRLERFGNRRSAPRTEGTETRRGWLRRILRLGN